MGYNPTGVSVLFQGGIQLGNGSEDYGAQYRLLDGGQTPPTPAANRLWGDFRLNQHPAARKRDGVGGSTNLQGAIYLTGSVAAGDATLPVNVCPTIPVGTPIAATSETPPAQLDQDIGDFRLVGASRSDHAAGAFGLCRQRQQSRVS